MKRQLATTWRGAEYCFEVQLNPLSTPRMLAEMIRQAKQAAGDTNRNLAERRRFPMVIMPYLSKKALDSLAAEGVSGIDLCGNGILTAGELFIYVTGEKNKYPKSTKLRNVYCRKSSLISAALLLFPEKALGPKEIADRIEWLNEDCLSVTISVSQVSKVLRQMEEDMLVARKNGKIFLLQPEYLLEKLRQNYIPPRQELCWKGWCKNPWDVAKQLAEISRSNTHDYFMQSGKTSASVYSDNKEKANLKIYTTADPIELLSKAGLLNSIEEGRKFANLKLIQTNSEWVYFGSRSMEVSCASKLQTWLELCQGDKRQKELAEQVHEKILKYYRQHKCVEGI